MKVSCPSCQTNYNIDDKRIPPGGAKLKCARCQNTFPIKPGGESASAPAAPPPAANPAAIPLPGATTQAAIPLPGATAPQADPYAAYDEGDMSGRWDAESTRVVAMPVPSAAYGDHSSEATSQAIPLPGAHDAYGAGAPPAYESEPATRADLAYMPQGSEAIPLPGAGEADPYAADVPSTESVPLPGAATDSIPLPPPPDAGSYGDPFSQAGADPYGSATDSIPLPPPPSEGVPLGEDPFDQPPAPSMMAPSVEDPFALPPPPTETAPASADPFDLPMAEDPFALPPPPTATDTSADFNLDFSEPPPPAGAEPGSSADFNLDFSEPPPPSSTATTATDLGDLGFGEPVAMGTPASIPDSLEFDPSAPVRPDAGDDLEADLSAPLPPPPAAGQADGLEMLSFIDDSAKENAGKAAPATKVRRFHVRRRSGKVFGPFDEGVVVKMLEDGQLLGNEDVSPDGDNWVPIGTVPIFAEAIQKLMEGPGPTPVVAGTPTPPTATENAARAEASANNMERLNRLYEGRMAAVAVVDNVSPMEKVQAKVKQHLKVIIASAAAVLVVGTGLSFGFTRYGVFGHKLLLPAKVSEDSPAFADVKKAREELLQDTFQSYKQARELSAKVLQEKEYPEVRALYCQSVFYLQRRYASATPGELQTCEAAIEEIELLGEKNVELVKVIAGKALKDKQQAEVLPRLSDALNRESGQNDVELAFLLAEAYAAQRQPDQAIGTLKRVLEKHPESAKAHHALGNLYQGTSKADEAVKAYEAALKADPQHVISAVELAAVELLLRKDAQKGLAAVERALDEKLQKEMGPAEVARALSLKGIALAALFNLKQAEVELRAALEKEPASVFIKGHLARVLRAQRQYAAALPLYKEVAAADPQNIEFAEGYVTLLVVSGNMQEAFAAVEKANTRFQGNARIAHLFGRIDDARDNLSSAEAHFKRAIAADPQFFEAHVSLGRFYLRLRRLQEAREQFEQAAAKAPENAAVRAGLGELALAENAIPRAQQEFKRAVELNPNLADAHLGLSRLALLAGNVEEAQKEIQTALELDPHSLPGGRLQNGRVLWRLGKMEEAIAELEKAKTEDPRSVDIPITLGAARLAKGDTAEAESNLLLALGREPSNPEANFYMAQVKAKRSEFTQAIDSMKNAVDRAPKRADYRLAFGVIFKDAKRPAEALEQWKEAVKLDPTLADAHEALGQAHLDRGDFDAAIDAFQASLKADPQRTRALAYIGDTHFAATRWREAIRSYESALKADAKLTFVYYKLGRSYSEQGQYAKAIDWFRKATQEDPTNAMAWNNLGYAYKEKGKRKEAVQAFKEYIQLKPDAADRKEVADEIDFLQQ
jgi:predicted Zn finger-like uncharacterized protein